jgi:hypothetical protein
MLVQCAINIQPEKNDGHKLIINSLGKVSNIDWSRIIKKHENFLISKGFDVPKTEKEGCFIATAAMGNYNHPQVIELRNFRDQWVLKKRWGKTFVKLYYKYGVFAAKYISRSYVTKKISYVFIVKPLVFFSRKVK